MADKTFQNWLFETVYRLIDVEYCTRFMFRHIKGFETLCLRTILCGVLREPKIISKIDGFSGIDFLLIVSENGTIDQNQELSKAKVALKDIMSYQFKFPMTLSPFPVAGSEKDQICELIELSNFMVCRLPYDGTDNDRFYLEYAKSAEVTVENWYDWLS